jgi:predicted enzyme related to lactoylglutathione lyase
MSDTTPGRFVWYDHQTFDPKAAVEFYTHAIGWTQVPYEGDYTMVAGSQGPLGGISELPERVRKAKAPAHWLGHVEVADVDATVADAQKLGGRVYVEAHDIPKIGRSAIIGDPQYAPIGVFKPSAPMALHDSTKAGEFCWHELLAGDHEAAFAFYAKLFGWKKSRDFDMGPMGNYLIYGIDGVDLGGMFTKPKEMQGPPHWVYYVEVSDLDAAIARAKDKGAKLLNGPMDVPGGARIAQLDDPQGGGFALHAKKA